ncbi:FAD-dependent oxidoreductase [Sphingomonas crocodyli]|uniref:GMC family oxidoreductase n=1 Tax=Sphingomonas crocodyli TaxID=1979270 RepID=A0A437MB70_9SPHN|nr:GMC family oxidoreductase [Sphingomonas crocodyli]RVT94882.1 GMC family oxidoreductase [Sphingomonas crocodyli]
MHIDLVSADLPPIHSDVAIIGAGAAGLTLARRFLSAGLSIVLIESGGLDYERETAALNDGANIGQEYYPLEDARLRFFGGTTAIWGGRVAKLDPIDFEKRAWVPHSGWPIGHEDIAPYYREARRALGLRDAPPVDRSPHMPGFDADNLVTPYWSFDEMFDRFSFARSRDVVDHRNATVLTHATVREIVADPAGKAIDRLDIVAPGGRRTQVHARAFVLAAGGIENPRLLLASQSVQRQGLGNGHDQVGRYFMEHPHARGGRVVDGAVWSLLAAFAKREADGETIAPMIAPSPALQAREGLLNSSLTIAPRRPAHGSQPIAMRAYNHAKHNAAPTQTGRRMWRTVKQVVGAAQRVSDPLRPWVLNRLGISDVALVVRAEQAPNPDSRVLLGSDRDATGMQRATLDWRTTALDVDSVGGLVDALGGELARLGLGRVERAAWLSDAEKAWVSDPLISVHPIGGYHHIGTTRMSADPRHGVTDGDTRVHGIANLYVAGSSLFPTSGWANPTLTIIALAMRTADHVAGVLGREQPDFCYAEAAE